MDMQIFSGLTEGVAHIGMFHKMAYNGKQLKSVSLLKTIDKLWYYRPVTILVKQIITVLLLS